ncbi:PPOX class F420-dependent oxidoreductase [Nocardioides montaniterrae]
MDLDQALGAARATHQSVLTTIKRDGRPQLSNVMHAVNEMGVVRVSTTADRAKARNLGREPWAALHVNGSTFFSYAVLECTAELSPVAADTHDAVVDELVDLYRAIGGEHDDWDAYRRAMVEDRRLVVRLTPERAYGMLS